MLFSGFSQIVLCFLRCSSTGEIQCAPPLTTNCTAFAEALVGEKYVYFLPERIARREALKRKGATRSVNAVSFEYVLCI